MSKVYIVNFAGHNYEQAEEYGEIVPVTIGYISMGSLDRILFDVITGLKNSTPEDWLLPSGLIAVNLIAGAIWMRMHGKIKILLWDRKSKKGESGGRYREMKFDADHVDFLVRSLCGGGEQKEEVRPEGRPDTS